MNRPNFLTPKRPARGAAPAVVALAEPCGFGMGDRLRAGSSRASLAAKHRDGMHIGVSAGSGLAREMEITRGIPG